MVDEDITVVTIEMQLYCITVERVQVEESGGSSGRRSRYVRKRERERKRKKEGKVCAITLEWGMKKKVRGKITCVCARLARGRIYAKTRNEWQNDFVVCDRGEERRVEDKALTWLLLLLVSRI